MTKTYRQASRSATEIRFADPDAIQNTAFVKVAIQPKKAGSSTVYNANGSLNLQRTITLPKPEGCADNCGPIDQEKIALRFSISGSTKSKTEVKGMIADFRAWLSLIEDDLVAGFLPETLTLVTV